ncbi:DnaT-like ssDNA-binding domain-containing protein [Marinobacterium sediminicola]|uniref:DnaT DNA-binding domain-containing protein n=1 Tax=Marinobacterium sediminicola TaxID=518898 RepID=A0ABY1RY14_9GAMM|nr:DnaT-like ssDNA-binding domain-containing protein [Marinobacterium sediminicola]ULG68608.1 hypothetical protein LN244_13020 [Marinobacterium sediminicola]SMR73128.1 hypothetical protein SAMN04487964_10369 [Marinobacterium sediminicola]
MRDWLPEAPVLFYPSLARELGSDEALLLTIYADYARHAGMHADDGSTECILPHSRWLQLADFWSEERLRRATDSLASQGCLQVSLNQGGSVRLRLLPRPKTETPAHKVPEPPPALPVQPVQQLPVYDSPPSRPVRGETMMQRRGPAPTFGGSIGWRRHKDELQAIFEQAEERNQQLQSMQLGWQPSDMFHAMLPRHSIPPEFASECLDEFVLYWLDKDRKESNWDQKFLAWVKREWVKKQTRDAREQRYEQERQPVTGGNDENTRFDSREKRKRITAAIMDIKDTDW